MGIVRLTGTLTCRSEEDLAVVQAHLPDHIALSRAEPGCIHFDVEQSADPLVWTVSESFASPDAFDAHQKRGAASAWGRATKGIPRDFTVTED